MGNRHLAYFVDVVSADRRHAAGCWEFWVGVEIELNPIVPREFCQLDIGTKTEFDKERETTYSLGYTSPTLLPNFGKFTVRITYLEGDHYDSSRNSRPDPIDAYLNDCRPHCVLLACTARRQRANWRQ